MKPDPSITALPDAPPEVADEILPVAPEPETNEGAGDPDPEAQPAQADMLQDGEPGVGLTVIPEVLQAAIEYKNIRDRRQNMTKEECASKADLITAMKKHGLKTYRFDDQQVVLSEKETVKVNTLGDDAPDDLGSE